MNSCVMFDQEVWLSVGVEDAFLWFGLTAPAQA